MVFKKTVKFSDSVIIFTVIALWYAVTNFIWWHLNTPNFPCHDLAALHFLYVFKDYVSNCPVIIWIFKFLLSIFGNEHLDKITISVNYVFFLIPLYFIYKIGEEIDSKETGNIAMILFALVPVVYGLSRQFGHRDYHLLATMTFNIYCLIKTNNFHERKWSILYGLSSGIGLLIKDTMLIYLFPTFVCAVIIALREKYDARRKINIAIALICGTILIGGIYFQPQTIKKIFSDPVTLVVPILFPESLRVMTLNLYEQLLSPPIFFIFVLGLVYFFKKYKYKNKGIILVWIFAPWLIIFLMPHYKVPEYLTGFIPPIVLVSSIFLSHIKQSSIKKAVLIFLIIIGIIQYINFSYYPTALFSKMRIKIHGIDFMYYDTATEHIMNFDVKNRCKQISQVIKRIKKEYPASSYAVYMDSQSGINNKVIRVCMLLNGMSCAVVDIEKLNIRPEDEVVIIGGQFLIGAETHRPEEKIMEYHPMVINALAGKNIAKGQYDEKQLNKQDHFIDKNFNLTETFYFNDVIDKNNKIQIFTRKKE